MQGRARISERRRAALSTYLSVITHKKCSINTKCADFFQMGGDLLLPQLPLWQATYSERRFYDQTMENVFFMKDILQIKILARGMTTMFNFKKR